MDMNLRNFVIGMKKIQVCKDLPKDSIYQRIQRDRAFYKIYFDFCEASKKGATAIVK